MKNILVFILSFGFIFPVFSMYENKSPIDAANFLAWKGIIVDRSSNTDLYGLDDFIQRQAVMKVVMKLSGKDIPSWCQGKFSDIDTNDWPCKYIEAALDSGYIAQNDTFRPYDNITLSEALKLVLKSKNITKVSFWDNWQEDYMLTAFEYGLIEKKFTNYDDNATRGWIFQLASATLEREKETEEKIEEKEEVVSDEAL